MLIDNDFISTKWKDEKIIIRVISELKIKSNLEEYVKSFINLDTFPYVNTSFNNISSYMYPSMNGKDKIEIIANLSKNLNEIDEKCKEIFEKYTDDELEEYFCMDKSDIKNNSRAELFKSVRGGQYCEMLLSNILISQEFKKILPKLYLQWGLVSPTGIDVPYINLKTKELVLGECKIYKNIKAAIKSCYKDLNNIYNNDKLDKELSEWPAKIKQIPDEVYEFFVENDIIDSDAVINKSILFDKLNDVIAVGFVMGNQFDGESLEKELQGLIDFDFKEKFKVVLFVIELNSKDEFISYCYKTIADMLKELRENDSR